MLRRKILPICLLFLSVLAFSIDFSLAQIATFPNEIYVDYSEVQQANENNLFGKLIKMELDEKERETSGAKKGKGEVVFKLFGLIPIKRISASILPEEDVYVGGNSIGLSVKTDGALVISDSVIDVNNAEITKNKYLKAGDIITSFNKKEIVGVDELVKEVKEAESDVAEIEVLRKAEKLQLSVPLFKNKGQYRLGIWAKDGVSGIGTLTFVKENNAFGALGHAVSNEESGDTMPIIEGNIYSCNLVNIVKGERNKAGELQAVFVERNKEGVITKNTEVGIFGKLDGANLLDENRKTRLGGRLSVKTGAAKLVSSVSGINEEYDIEIIKANYQSKSSSKSFVFRVKDKRLLELTGGIVQGMSGSPILQDGKIVGAVTHVFLSDPTKGYGVYVDWMLENIE